MTKFGKENNMRKLYEKKEILFAVLWIVAYCVVLGTIRGNFGDESIYMLIALIVFTAGIIAFVKINHLEEKYGLDRWPKNMKKYLFFIPMWILASCCNCLLYISWEDEKRKIEMCAVRFTTKAPINFNRG